MKTFMISIMMAVVLTLSGCGQYTDSTNAKVAQEVQAQQGQYAIGQPVPKFDWSLERHLLTQLYSIRNQKVATHAVWRSNYGSVEGDCPSLGFGLPYDTSLTNPLASTDEDQRGNRNNALTSVGQAEPNGIFASTNTSATWVMCTGKAGAIEPIYVESKVTIYPYAVDVDYGTNHVMKAGETSVTVSTQ